MVPSQTVGDIEMKEILDPLCKECIGNPSCCRR